MGAAALVAPLAPSVPALASERGMNQYVKRKRSDPLETYIPPLIAARIQLQQAMEVMAEAPDTARQLLRKGAMDGVRSNVRVVGEYAVQDAGQPDAEVTKIVKGFFLALEKYDRVLLIASRDEVNRKLPAEAKDLGDAAIAALDKVLTLVPEEMVAKAREIIAALQAEEATFQADKRAAEAVELTKEQKGLEGLLPTQ